MTLLMLITPLINVYALSLSENNVTIESGSNKAVELYANSEQDIISVTFTMVYSTYDIPASFEPAGGFNDTNPNGITHEVIFDEAKNGKIKIGNVNINVVQYPTDTVGTINIHTATAKTTDGTTINLDAQNINVKVGKEEEPVKEEPKSVLLKKIESKLVKVELKEKVFEYNIEIDSNVEELDIKAIPEDENAKVEISTQKIKDIKDNKIIITVKNGDNNEKKYTLNIKQKEKIDNDVTIDKSEFKGNNSYKGKWIIITIFLIIALMVSLILSRKGQ